jgi:hypothetical protein
MFTTLNFIAIWLPRIFFGGVFILALLAYRHIRKGSAVKKITLRGLVIISVIFKFCYAALLTVFQYFIWKADPFSHLLLSDSLSELPKQVTGGLSIFNGQLGYFIYYVISHFWLDAIWSITLAFAFWLILKSLQKYRSRFFYQGETEIGLIAALIVGWPNLLIFVPLVFFSVVLISIYRLIFLKESYTTIGWPLLLAVILTLLTAHFLGPLIGLSSWRIY